jgi:hypothetical protein
MTNQPSPHEAGAEQQSAEHVEKKQSDPLRPLLVRFPGLALISLYLLALALVIIFGVVGGHYPALFLVFAAGSLTASAGLLKLFRWAWAMGLAAVLMLVIYNLWIFSSLHQGPALVQGLFNLVFFLYLVRPEIREGLR